MSDIGSGSQGDVCVCVCVCACGRHVGITQTSILLDSCSLPSDASHLRQRHSRPSKPSACRSLLIDLSLDEVFGNASGRICILTDALHENVYHTQKRAGP